MRKLGAGFAGGLIAGALVGAAEALVTWRTHPLAVPLPPIGWAAVVYGVVGAVLGLAIGVAASVLRTGGFGLALASVAAGLGFAVARFRIVRDVFGGQMPPGLVPTFVQLGGLAMAVGIAILIWRELRLADERRGLLTRPGVAAALVALVAIASLLVESMVPRERAVPPAAAGTAPSGAPNVILVVVDSLRADHLRCYGADRVETPNIDALAADGGVRFAHTFAQASSTRPALATILSGLYPSSHGAVRDGDVLPERVETVAEVLARGGYHTVGFPNSADVTAPYGFAQGFAEYRYLTPERFLFADQSAAELTLYGRFRVDAERLLAHVDVDSHYRPAEEVVERAEQWLDASTAATRPFFLFLHFMDPHEPYMVHPWSGVGYGRFAMPNPPAEMADTLRKTYDADVAYLDGQLGKLFRDLDRRGILEKSLVILTADHGEELHEHGGWWHGGTLYDEQIAVPLIVKPAGRAVRGSGRVVEELASSLDVAPTILAAARLTPPTAMQGHALPLDGSPAPERDAVFAEETVAGSVLSAVRTKEWKLVTATAGNPRGLAPIELYDVGVDPTETKNLATAEPERREEMRAALGRQTLEARAHTRTSVEPDVDAATKARLKALGYLKE
jgi:arylsulfatase A-like enzyme